MDRPSTTNKANIFKGMEMKISLLDLNHTSCGIHTNTVPLGLGLISRYVNKMFGEEVDVKIFKNAEKVLEISKSWIPDIVGIAQYCWNSELNLFVASHIKKINPDVMVVAGGPDLELSSSSRKSYLEKRECIDICVAFDGEMPFTEIVKRLLAGESIVSIKESPGAGTYSFDLQNKRLVESVEKTIPRLSSLNESGSIFADGFFDEFLDDGFHPFVQTHRGCPFKCTFCHTSDRYYQKMIFQSPDLFKKDMDYLGKRFSGQDHIPLEMANTNMSLFKQDFEIAQIIHETQEKYNWPKRINVNSGKNPEKLLEMQSIIEFQPAIALQTLTSDVLQNIKRKNIPFKDYTAFQKKVMLKTKAESATELILCLPGETKETFLNTLRQVINSGVQKVVVYTLMNLKGTPLSTEKSAKLNGHIIRHRVVPRQFSIIDGTKILDTEEVIVGTKDMSFDDYVNLRGFSFVVNSFFNSVELKPLKRLFIEYQIDMMDWVSSIHDRLSEYSNLCQNYEAFKKETEDELFLTREALLEFFNKPKNFDALMSGRLGDNILRKYKLIMLSENYESCLELAVSSARKVIHERFNDGKKMDAMIDDLAYYLLTRNLKEPLLNKNYYYHKKFHLNYDIPRWLENTNPELLFENFKRSCNYSVFFTENTIKSFDDIFSINKDLTLSLQKLYRDGTVKEYWPQWVKNVD